MATSRMLNVGCGSVFHPEWENIDVAPFCPEVREVDATRSLPYPDNSFDMVYASHVLEHVAPNATGIFLHEIRRVLSPGGIVRIAVPDLEGIARAYLRALEDARTGGRKEKLRHRWMIIELIDQIARQFPDGGEMVRFLLRNGEEGMEVAMERLGSEITAPFTGGQTDPSEAKGPKSKKQWLFQAARDPLFSDEEIFKRRADATAYQIGQYRLLGEAHLWMYDAVSLGDLLKESGFVNVIVCQPTQSAHHGFPRYNLDTLPDGTARKPDSLYMEGRKTVE